MEQPLNTDLSPGPDIRLPTGRTPRQTALLLLCFLSGFSSLIYEVAWMRQLTFVFGVSAYATATVLCAFMGGLALGSWIFRRAADRSRQPLRLYAGLELGIGLYALLLPLVLHGLTPLYVVIHHLVNGESLLLNLARFLLAGLALLLPATLMGATMPVLGRSLVSHGDSVGADTARFYAVNTSGAVGGAFCAGFLLLGPLGTWNTTLFAVALNLAVAMCAWWMARTPWRQTAAAPPDLEGTPPGKPHALSGAMVRLTFLVFTLSGFISLAYEILWTRLLVFYLHNSTYAFSAMLVVFLVGLAAGSFAVGRLADRVVNAARALGLVEMGIGLASLGSILIYNFLPALAADFTRILPVNSFLSATLLIFFQAGLILLVPTCLMGAAFPLAARAVISDVRQAGRSLGSIYAANTVGTIAGAFLCGFVLIPTIGLGHTAQVLILSNLLLGAVLLLATGETNLTARVRWLLAVSICLALPPMLVPAQLFRQAFERRFAKVLYYRDEATDTVAVAETQPGNLDSRTIFYADGRGTAGIFSVPENRVSGHLPMLLHPDPRDVLVICFGVGNSLAAVARHPASRIHCVELSPGVIETAHFFRATNHDVLKDSRVKLFIEDGRMHLLTTKTSYDVVTLEPPEMHTAGVVNLYTTEFYQLVQKRLNPGGIVCQWLNIRKMPEYEFRMLINAFRAVFPHTTLWQPPKCFGILMVGTQNKLEIDLPRFLERFRRQRVYRDLAEVRLGDPYDFLSQFLMGEEETAAYAGDAPQVTDDRTYVDFSVPRSVMADYAVSGFFAGLDLTVHDRSGQETSTQAGYAKIRRFSHQRGSVSTILKNIDMVRDPAEVILSRLQAQTEEKRASCDTYGLR